MTPNFSPHKRRTFLTQHAMYFYGFLWCQSLSKGFLFAEKSSGSSCWHCQRCLRHWKFHFHELDWHLGIDFIAASGRRFERNPRLAFFTGWCDQKGAYLHAALCWSCFFFWEFCMYFMEPSHGIIPPVSSVWMNFIQETFIFWYSLNMPDKHPVESPCAFPFSSTWKEVFFLPFSTRGNTATFNQVSTGSLAFTLHLGFLRRFFEGFVVAAGSGEGIAS